MLIAPSDSNGTQLEEVIIIVDGFKLYQWAAERGLEIPLLIGLIALLAVLIVIASKIKEEPHSLCNDCVYKNNAKKGVALACGSYKPIRWFMFKQRSECPVEQLFREIREHNETKGL